MLSDELKKMLYDKDIDNDLKSNVFPILLEEFKSQKRKPLTRLLTSAPFAALLSAVLVAGITELIRQQTRGEELIHERTLERQKFQYDVISSSLSELKTPSERAETLRFLHDIKILDGLDEDKLTEWASEDSSPPAFSGTITSKSVSDLLASLTEEDLLARTLFGEARGGSVEQQENVASVILNRVRTEYRGDTLGMVVLAHRQFASWLPGSPQRDLLMAFSPNDPTLEPFSVIARRALEGAITDRTGGARHYHSKSIKPVWADSAELTLDDGLHLFYVGVD